MSPPSYQTAPPRNKEAGCISIASNPVKFPIARGFQRIWRAPSCRYTSARLRPLHDMRRLIMLNWNGGVGRRGRAVLGACLALVVAQTAAAEMYAWRTDDGGYAYTDDKDQIPERYRAQAKRVSSTSLKSYERYTPQDPQASAQYAERLERRLAALRAANAAAPHAPVAHAAPA